MENGMDKETLKALEGSIGKWSLICYGVAVDGGSDDCALCWKFHMHYCVGCPVLDRTGRDYCHESPYYEFDDEFGETLVTVLSAEQAEAMLIFLCSLLPEGHEWYEVYNE